LAGVFYCPKAQEWRSLAVFLADFKNVTEAIFWLFSPFFALFSLFLRTREVRSPQDKVVIFQ
jgi:hypothetical protein